jgi:3',5'-cyclic-AMP phosphodiesterase
MTSLRLALVTDIHHGHDTFTKKGSAAAPLMEEFRRFVIDGRVDAVIDLGDRISDVSGEADRRLEHEVAEMFAPIASPVFHVCGNHDRAHLSVADNVAILGQDLGHFAIDLGDWRLVFWRADTRIHPQCGFVLAEADLVALGRAVATADRPLAIFGHVPVSGHAQTGNYWFERNPASATYPDADRVRAILRSARVPVVWVAGHVHWNTLTMVDGIPHLTLQSLTETFTTFPEPAGAMAILELSDRILWEVSGRDGVRFDLPARADRWMVLLPPFDEMPEIRLARLRMAAE